MTSKQKWVGMFLAFGLGLSIVAALLLHSIVSLPVASSEFDIEGDYTYDGETGQWTLTLNRIHGRMDTRILDLLVSLSRSRD